jgi:hypothetical protein
LKQICKLKSEIGFFETKDSIQQNTFDSLSKDKKLYLDDLNGCLDHLKNLENLIDQTESEIKKIDLIVNDPETQEIRRNIQETFNQNELEIKKLNETLKEEIRKDSKNKFEFKNIPEINLVLSELNSSFKFNIDENMIKLKYQAFDFQLSFHVENSRVLNFSFHIDSNGKGENARIEKYLLNSIGIESICSNVKLVNEIPTAVQILSFKLNRIEMLKLELETLTNNKIYYKSNLNNHQMLLELSITDFKTKRFVIKLPLSTNWPFESFSNFGFNRGNTNLKEEEIGEIISGTETSYTRISEICANLKTFVE